jgi:uncharacterized integral membrane protein
MRLFKAIVALVILGLAALFIYQNMPTWTQTVGFKLNLGFFQTDPAGVQLEQYIVILVAGLFGLIVGLALMLKPYFKVRRLLKRERMEKKQAEEANTLRQARAESHAEAIDPANPAE